MLQHIRQMLFLLLINSKEIKIQGGMKYRLKEMNTECKVNGNSLSLHLAGKFYRLVKRASESSNAREKGQSTVKMLLCM